MTRSFFFALLCLISVPLLAQKKLLRAGPMPGYSEMREVPVWLQTTEPAKVKMTYWDRENPKERFQTAEVYTVQEDACTALLLADQVLPGKTYDYKLAINGKSVDFDSPLSFHTQTLWQYRTNPPDFSFAIGSCTYVNEAAFDRPGKPYGGEYQIFDAIANKQPKFMLWLGDNIYLRRADWNSRTGILHRYSDMRQLPEMQSLLRQTHHYAIWDDHDFGPNDSDRSFVHKDWTLEAFKLFWANPSYGINDRPGITSAFSYLDLDFFLLDNRSYRSPKNIATTELTILGQEQLDWLIDALKTSKSPYKLVAVGGQVLNTAARFENFACWPEERQAIIDRIIEEKITGVVFLTGDRHHSELSRFHDEASGITIYDVTASPLSSGSASSVTEENKLRVDGTLVTQRNFGVLSLSGSPDERKLRVSLFDVNGALLWDRTLD